MELSSSDVKVMARHVKSGALAGLVNDVLMHPIDTMRAQINVRTSDSSNPVREFQKAIVRTYKSEGLRGFYRGYGTMLCFSPLCNAVYYGSHELFRFKLQGSHSGQPLVPEGLVEPVSGFCAQLLTSVAWTPGEIVAQRMQVHSLVHGNRHPRRSMWQELRALARRGHLFRGLVASWLVWTPFSVAYFTTFERTRALLTEGGGMPRGGEGGAWATDLLCGTVAGVSGAAVSHPIDCLKTRIQALPAGNSGSGVAAMFRVGVGVVRREGLRTLFAGVCARVLWLAPGTAISITVFEALKGGGYG